LKRKWLTVGIILLFIGVAVAPSINLSVVKASNDNDLVEVTTQACGIQGYENTTVQLTRQQYRNLEQYLVDFRARLNQTSTRVEAVPIFKEAVVELNKYGLLPKGMSVEQAQKLITGENQHILYKTTWQKMSKKIHGCFESLSNFFCLISGTTTNTFFQPLLSYVIWISYIPLQFLFTIAMILLLHGLSSIILTVIVTLLESVGSIMAKSLDFMFKKQPILFGANMWLGDSNGWINTIGLNGVKKIEGDINGVIPEKGLFDSLSKAWVFGYTDPKAPSLGARGFIGLRLLLSDMNHNSFYIGTVFRVDISNN
jgi:hypothetical protein